MSRICESLAFETKYFDNRANQISIRYNLAMEINASHLFSILSIRNKFLI